MKYIALTLGPIVDTLVLGRKTSEIWMASYLFSSFMKKTIKEIKETTDAKFIVPFVEDETLFSTKDDGIGMFHDRFILTSERFCLEDIQPIIIKQKKELSKMIATAIKRDEKKVEAFMQSYMQTYLFESEEQFENPLLDISDILDSIELHTPLLESDEDYMRLFLNRDILLNSTLAKDSFGKKPSFDDIKSISAQELGEDVDATNAYKYIAIIHADGDNLGKYIKEQSDVNQISKKLFEFDKQAVITIKEYGALPLFVGGDDLLIFSPVINKGKTIFDLMNSLSKDYQDALQTNASTLSFGVSITYYKFPLYEALESSREALFAKAKKYESKDAVAINVQKHSGQTFGFSINKQEQAYTQFSNLISTVLNEEIELPHAIHHKLHKHQALFQKIKLTQLKDTFENIFNEDIHQHKFKEGLTQIQELMNSLGLEKEQQEKLFSMLSTIKLLRGDR